jgi:hypothetical protein
MAKTLTDADFQDSPTAAPTTLTDADFQTAPGNPVAAIGGNGSSAAPEEDTPVTKLKRWAKLAAGTVGKVMDPLSAAAVRAPIANLAMGGTDAQGKPLIHPGEGLLDTAVNPTNLQRYPDLSVLFARKGIKNPQLSDVMPGYATPGTSHPWYQPEKGGFFDPSMAGALQMAADPINLIGVGELSAAAKATAENAVTKAGKTAAKNLRGNVLTQGAGAVSDAAGAAADAANTVAGAAPRAITAATQKLPLGVGAAVTKAATLPSDVVAGWGKKLYRSLIEPVEYQGEKYGKSGVADTMYQTGITSPFGLRAKSDAITTQIMNDRDAILRDTTAEGGRVSMSDAMAQAQAKVDKIRAARDPELQPVADAIQARIDEYKRLESGTPGTPGTPPQTIAQNSPILGPDGKPVQTQVTIPGTPGTPGTPGRLVTPTEATGFKSSLYNTLPGTAYDNAVKTGAGASIQKSMAKGLKEGVEDSAYATGGPKAAQDLTDLNDAAGKFIGTKKAQTLAGHQASRTMDRIASSGGTEGLVGGLAATEGPWAVVKAIAAKKALDLLRLGSMGSGAKIRALAENPFTGGAFNAWFYNKLKQEGTTDQAGPWSQPGGQ